MDEATDPQKGQGGALDRKATESRVTVVLQGASMLLPEALQAVNELLRALGGRNPLDAKRGSTLVGDARLCETELREAMRGVEGVLNLGFASETTTVEEDLTPPQPAGMPHQRETEKVHALHDQQWRLTAEGLASRTGALTEFGPRVEAMANELSDMLSRGHLPVPIAEALDALYWDLASVADSMGLIEKRMARAITSLTGRRPGSA